MKPAPLLLILCLTNLGALAQDTLVRFQDLTFRSDLERKVLEDHFLKNNSQYFMLAMANGLLLNETSVSRAKEKFYSHIQSLDTEKFQTKKPDKKIKQAYDDIHKTFLVKYELKNRFEDIFNNGYYNCVSASLLYALAFEQLHIPFQIVEKPTHVYLVAYPEKESIIVETTTPMAGFFEISDQFKLNYLKVLKEQKLISAQEFSSANTNTLFDKYYFGDQTNITLEQLIGLQYLNEGLYNLDEEKHLDALYQFEKAYMLYPSERVGYLLMLAAYNAFTGMEKKDEAHALCLAKLSRYKKFGIKGDVVQGEFVGVINELLFEKGEKEKLDSYYKVLHNHLVDTVLKTDVAFIYNYENGRMLHNKSKFKEALPYLEEVLNLKPHHQDGNSLFISCLVKSFKNIENADIISRLEHYSTKHQLLLENNVFNELFAVAYLIEFDHSYQENNAVKGEKYRLLFENLKKAHSDLPIDAHLVANAYSSGALYYFKKGQDSKAKSLLAAGLQVSPDNYELKMRKKSFD